MLHRTGGTIASALAWLADPESKVSYHCIIDARGLRHDIMPDSYAAWHAGAVVKPTWTRAHGDVNPNMFTLGVALEGAENDPITREQFVALCEYIAEKCAAHKIPVDKSHIINHNEIRADKACPGHALQKGPLIFTASLPQSPGSPSVDA